MTSYEAVCAHAAKEAKVELAQFMQVDSYGAWEVYPYCILDAPGENALMQSLQRYPKEKVIDVDFQLVGRAWVGKEEMDEKVKRLPRHILSVVITSLHNMQPRCFGQRAPYLFAGEVVRSDPKFKRPDAHEGKRIVGITLTESHNGGCYLFGESSPAAYRRLEKVRSAWLHKHGCPITADELRDGDFSKVPETDKEFQEMMFTAKTIHDEKVASGMIPLSSDWMQAMNPHHRWHN